MKHIVTVVQRKYGKARKYIYMGKAVYPKVPVYQALRFAKY